jgi:tetratricopeptide (TPR) repeat protein
MLWPVLLTLALPGATSPALMNSLQEALVLEQRGDDEAALRALDALEAGHPVWELPRLEGARIRLKRGGELDRVRYSLEVAQALVPENPRAAFLWAQLMEERGRADLAAQALDVAVALRPGYADAHLRLAHLAFGRGDYPRAETHYRAVKQLDASSVPARLQLALTLQRLGRARESEGELKSLLKAQPGSTVALRRLAELYDQTQRPEEARKVRSQLEAPAPKRKMRELKPSRR